MYITVQKCETNLCRLWCFDNVKCEQILGNIIVDVGNLSICLIVFYLMMLSVTHNMASMGIPSSFISSPVKCKYCFNDVWKSLKLPSQERNW